MPSSWGVTESWKGSLPDWTAAKWILVLYLVVT